MDSYSTVLRKKSILDNLRSQNWKQELPKIPHRFKGLQFNSVQYTLHEYLLRGGDSGQLAASICDTFSLPAPLLEGGLNINPRDPNGWATLTARDSERDNTSNLEYGYLPNKAIKETIRFLGKPTSSYQYFWLQQDGTSLLRYKRNKHNDNAASSDYDPWGIITVRWKDPDYWLVAYAEYDVYGERVNIVRTLYYPSVSASEIQKPISGLLVDLSDSSPRKPKNFVANHDISEYGSWNSKGSLTEKINGYLKPRNPGRYNFLFMGESGIGKTNYVLAYIQEYLCDFLIIRLAPEDFSRFSIPQWLTNVVIVIDDGDLMAPRRDIEVKGNDRTAHVLRKLEWSPTNKRDHVGSLKVIVTMITCNHPERIDHAVIMNPQRMTDVFYLNGAKWKDSNDRQVAIIQKDGSISFSPFSDTIKRD